MKLFVNITQQLQTCANAIVKAHRLIKDTPIIDETPS